MKLERGTNLVGTHINLIIFTQSEKKTKGDHKSVVLSINVPNKKVFLNYFFEYFYRVEICI